MYPFKGTPSSSVSDLFLWIGRYGSPWVFTGILGPTCQVCKKPSAVWRCLPFIWGVLFSHQVFRCITLTHTLLGSSLISLRVLGPLWLSLSPDFPSAFSLDICLCCGSLQVHTQHPLFEGGICASCKVSREAVGLTWHWRGRSQTASAPCSGHVPGDHLPL